MEGEAEQWGGWLSGVCSEREKQYIGVSVEFGVLSPWGCTTCSARTPGSPGSPTEHWAPALLSKVAQLPLSLKDKAWHHVCVAWTTRDGKWSAYQDGEQRGAGENLASWHAIKPQGVIILGQEQVCATPTRRPASSHCFGVKLARGAAPKWGEGRGWYGQEHSGWHVGSLGKELSCLLS